jgi:hypothetical protein
MRGSPGQIRGYDQAVPVNMPTSFLLALAVVLYAALQSFGTHIPANERRGFRLVGHGSSRLAWCISPSRSERKGAHFIASFVTNQRCFSLQSRAEWASDDWQSRRVVRSIAPDKRIQPSDGLSVLFVQEKRRKQQHSSDRVKFYRALRELTHEALVRGHVATALSSSLPAKHAGADSDCR